MTRQPSTAGHRDARLPKLGQSHPDGPVLLDTNVFINALTGRGPTVLRQMLETLPRFFVSAPTRAELAWIKGRLDPAHPGTARVLAAAQAVQDRIDPAKVLVPDSAEWTLAGERAGRIARELAGGGRRTATAFDRVELIHDTLTAIVAARFGCVVITEDRDFAALLRHDRRLRVLFYDRIGA
ncbi:MAG TPA: PIN domain-containing protein [Acetobacteraceae bacterium]|jgi:predicted nucleic acid-binding protein